MTTGRRILVVDDDATNRLVVRVLLERRGFEIVEAEGGAEALDLFARVGADLVLMDISMPDMDGFETTRRLRAAGPGGATVPIVALTAHTSAAERAACDACGMDGFLEKPFDVQVAMHSIRFMLDPPIARSC